MAKRLTTDNLPKIFSESKAYTDRKVEAALSNMETEAATEADIKAEADKVFGTASQGE